VCGQTVYPRSVRSLIPVLLVLVVLGVFGLGGYLANAADVLIWVLVVALVWTALRAIVNRAKRRGPTAKVG
jgi:L-lactate permease